MISRTSPVSCAKQWKHCKTDLFSSSEIQMHFQNSHNSLMHESVWLLTHSGRKRIQSSSPVNHQPFSLILSLSSFARPWSRSISTVWSLQWYLQCCLLNTCLQIESVLFHYVDDSGFSYFSFAHECKCVICKYRRNDNRYLILSWAAASIFIFHSPNAHGSQSDLFSRIVIT